MAKDRVLAHNTVAALYRVACWTEQEAATRDERRLQGASRSATCAPPLRDPDGRAAHGVGGRARRMDRPGPGSPPGDARPRAGRGGHRGDLAAPWPAGTCWRCIPGAATTTGLLRGVSSTTRSPSRPNPLGLHRVTVREVTGSRLRVGPIEAVDGTPVVDIKSVLKGGADG
ncbi:MAG: TrmO family methyltransferase [Desulfobacterales bacterium]|nr:TrmO family methyltransferase [Desulfobacterales bacterium]